MTFMSVDAQLLEILVCPRCKGDLEYREAESSLICHIVRCVTRCVTTFRSCLSMRRRRFACGSLRRDRDRLGSSDFSDRRRSSGNQRRRTFSSAAGGRPNRRDGPGHGRRRLGSESLWANPSAIARGDKREIAIHHSETIAARGDVITLLLPREAPGCVCPLR